VFVCVTCFSSYKEYTTPASLRPFTPVLLLIFIHNTHTPSFIHTGASPHIHKQHPHPFVYSHRRFSSYSCTTPAPLRLFTPALLLKFIHSTRTSSSIHTGASPHIHTQHPHPFVYSHRRFSSYSYTTPAPLRLFTPALLLISIHNTRIPSSIHTGASPHIHTQHPHPFVYSHRRFSSYSYTTPTPLRIFTPALLLIFIHNTRAPSSIHTGASPHMHTQHPHPFVHSHRCFSSYSYTTPAPLRPFTPALLLICIHSTRIPSSIHTGASPHIHTQHPHPSCIHTGASPHIRTQHPHPFVYSHRCFSSYPYTTPAPLHLLTPALLLIFIHNTCTPSSIHTGASPHIHTQHPHPFVYSHRRFSSYAYTTPASLRLFTPARLLIFRNGHNTRWTSAGANKRTATVNHSQR